MTQDLIVRRAEANDAERWDDYAAAHRHGLAYHGFAWKQAVEAAYQFICPYFYAEKGKKICGVMPLVHLRPPFGRGKLVSLPYCDAGGILADSVEIQTALFDRACQYAREHKIETIEMRFARQGTVPEADPARFPKVRMVLSLPGSVEKLLASFKSKLRSQVKKPARDGLYVRLGGAALLADFYPVFAANMTDLGSPVHSENWLRSILIAYGQKAKCGIVYMPDHTPAAGGIVLCHSRVVSIPWASSLKQFNRFNPNMFLYWSFLEYAAGNGYAFFDFGRSTPGEGTYHFKSQWGAKPQPLVWKQWKIDKEVVRENRHSATAGSFARARTLAEKTIRQMPLKTSVFFGSRIRKYISL